MEGLKLALLKGAVVLLPTYTVAYFTEKMIYVVPMLAAAGFVAAALSNTKHERRVDEDGIKEDGDG